MEIMGGQMMIGGYKLVRRSIMSNNEGSTSLVVRLG